MKTLNATLAAAIIMMSTLAAAQNIQNIHPVDGVASYPERYRGTQERDADEDPFPSPSNSALVLIDYQPHLLMGTRNIDQRINNTTGLIKSAVHFGLPIIYSHVGVGVVVAGASPIYATYPEMKGTPT